MWSQRHFVGVQSVFLLSVHQLFLLSIQRRVAALFFSSRWFAIHIVAASACSVDAFWNTRRMFSIQFFRSTPFKTLCIKFTLSSLLSIPRRATSPSASGSALNLLAAPPGSPRQLPRATLCMKLHDPFAWCGQGFLSVSKRQIGAPWVQAPCGPLQIR